MVCAYKLLTNLALFTILAVKILKLVRAQFVLNSAFFKTATLKLCSASIIKKKFRFEKITTCKPFEIHEYSEYAVLNFQVS